MSAHGGLGVGMKKMKRCTATCSCVWCFWQLFCWMLLVEAHQDLTVDSMSFLKVGLFLCMVINCGVIIQGEVLLYKTATLKCFMQ